jgi:hypothetical protein
MNPATVRKVLATVPRRKAGMLVAVMPWVERMKPSPSGPLAKSVSGGAASARTLLQSASSSSAAICESAV